MANYKISDECNLIKTLQSPACSREEANYILKTLWTNYSPFVSKYAHSHFSNSLFFDCEEIMQEGFLTFYDTLLKYNPEKGNLTTALALPLKHTFVNYIASQNGSTAHENRMISHFTKVLQHFNVAPNEPIENLTKMYNELFPQNKITSRSLAKYRDYYFMIQKTPIEQFTNFLPDLSLSVEHAACNQNLQIQLSACINKADAEYRPLLLFLFDFIDADSFKQQIVASKKTYNNYLIKSANFLYQNGLIEQNSVDALKRLVYEYHNL